MQKGQPLKFVTRVRGTLIKITTNFPVKIEFKYFSMGMTCMAKMGRGGGKNFW